MKIIGINDSWVGIEAFTDGSGMVHVVETEADYLLLPQMYQDLIARRAVEYAKRAAEAPVVAQYEAEQAAKQAAEFESFKARSGEPSYKAAAVKIAAEKLAMTPLIEAALDTLINADGDKAILVWWIETDAISRGDAQWQRIEGAVEWPKGVSATDLFELAAQI